MLALLRNSYMPLLAKRPTITPTKLLNSPRFFYFPPKTATLHRKPAPHDPSTNAFSASQYSALSGIPESPEGTFTGPLKLASRRKPPPPLAEVGVLHCKGIKSGFGPSQPLGNELLNLYVKCGSLTNAHNLFDEIPERDTLTWTILVSGYSRSGDHDTGLSLFGKMLAGGIRPNQFTLAGVLKCCMGSNDVEVGREVHGWIVRNGIESDVVLENSILELYTKFGDFTNAKNVFEIMTKRDVISWNIMIGACLQIGDVNGSMQLFRALPFRDVSSWNTIIHGHMQNGAYIMALQLLCDMGRTGPVFNQFTFSIALVLASKLVLLESGRQMHAQILRMGFEHDDFIRNSLLDMYCKCGRMESSRAVFNSILKSTFYGLRSKTISWSSMIAGYVQNGQSEEALDFFRRMLHERVAIDIFTLTSIAAACSDAGILEQGRQVHACVEKLGHGMDIFLASATTDMYAKCGSLEDACKVFDGMYCRNVVLWTSMIGSYALYGQGRDAIQVYENMLEQNIMPNEISFVGVLSACSHTGLIEEGWQYFRSMKEDYGIGPSIEHFTCMVDLLGRAGLLDEAQDFVQENNISHHAVVWKALLSACRVHNNTEMAAFVSKHLEQLKPCDVGSYVLLSNTYATQKNWMEASKTRSLMQDRGVRKQPGKSWIQLKSKVHTFVVGDRSHPQADEIYSYLEKLIGRLKEMGYSSRTSMVLHDLEEEQEELALGFHSEKLAIAYGIISSPCGLPVRVMKNLRICLDCHDAIKYISLAANREIILRDVRRFHQFRDGKCSCGDYW